MLKHEDNSETPPRSAAQVRVTPEELAAALTRLEARQGGLEGTIPLGDAVQELGLNTTPEELLREIEAGRARPQESHSRTPVPRANRLRVGIVCALALLLSGGMVAFLRSVPSRPVADSPAVAITLPAPQAVPKPISLDPNMMVEDASGKLVMLPEVGDNQPVRCNYSDGSFQPSTGGLSSWIIIKRNGQVYVRAWIPHMSDQAIQKNGAYVSTWESDLVDSDASHISHVPITLSLNGFQVVPGENNGEEVHDHEEFHAVNIRLDKYAYEKWKP